MRTRSVDESLMVGVEVSRFDLTASLNNVAWAKHAVLQGDMETALRRLDGALSWCWPMLGVDHPFMGEQVPGEPVLLLDLEGKSHPVEAP